MWMTTTTAVQPPGQKNRWMSLCPRWEVITNHLYIYIYYTSHFFLSHLVYFFVARRGILNNDCTNLSPLYLPSIVPHAFGLQLVSVSIIEPQLGVFHSLDTLQRDSPCQNPRRRVQGLQGTSMNQGTQATKANILLFSLW